MGVRSGTAFPNLNQRGRPQTYRTGTDHHRRRFPTAIERRPGGMGASHPHGQRAARTAGHVAHAGPTERIHRADMCADAGGTGDGADSSHRGNLWTDRTPPLHAGYRIFSTVVLQRVALCGGAIRRVQDHCPAKRSRHDMAARGRAAGGNRRPEWPHCCRHERRFPPAD